MIGFIEPSAPKTDDFIREARNENQKERIAPYRPSIDPQWAKLFAVPIPDEKISPSPVDWSFLDEDDGQPGEPADWVKKQIKQFEKWGDDEIHQ